ncbi:MAG: EAL domain-containing protein [Proteobacteria bacterium]|nr:EAL domain-containing protein [Pseudomonadota bacterium]
MAMQWFGKAGEGVADNAKGKRQPPSVRRVLLWAVLITSLLGAIEFFVPLEDLWRGGRNRLTLRPADQQVAAVVIDDRTIAAFGTPNYSEARDAELIEHLASLGARRIFFDRVFYSETDPAGVARLEQVLRRHPGLVYFGEMRFADPLTRKLSRRLPAPRYRGLVRLVTLNGKVAPFGLSAELPYVDMVEGKPVPSMSSELSGVRGMPERTYRPDWSINARSVPTASMIDVVNGAGARAMFRGRDVVVGPSSMQINDIQHIAGQDWLPGMYFHILGAQTLREGKPVNWGWVPIYLVMLGFSLAVAVTRGRKQLVAIYALAVSVMLIGPFVTDRLFITADFLPGVTLFGIVAYRLRAIRAVRHAEITNTGTQLPTVLALNDDPAVRQAPIIALRIRNFSAICTSFADPVGDELISAVVHRLTMPGSRQTFYQSEATLFWLAPHADRDTLTAHIEGLTRLLQAHFVVRGRQIDLQIAIGIETQLSRPVAARVSSALFAADHALLRNRVWEFFSDTDDKDVESQVSLIAELEAAMAAGHVWVAYQPQYSLADRRLTGFEALARWNHPGKGPIEPDLFITAAESMNRIDALTLHVLRRACLECRSMFETNPDITVSINVSTRLLASGDFVERAVELVDKLEVPRHRITLEITETAGFTDQAGSQAIMDSLTTHGFKLAIDDYGMGNATLNYLRTVPCDEIKIDRSFVTNLCDDKSNQLLVKSTIALAHKMGRVVVAEGVEDLRTMQLLRKFGCDIGQGYYLGRPMPIRDVLPLSVMRDDQRLDMIR